jgi:hypothetical protein
MQQEQKKIVSIKFIRVAWDEAPQRGVYITSPPSYNPPWDTASVLRERGLDIAHSELEAKISELLKEGWVMEGGIAYINPEKVTSTPHNGGWSHLVQKMVMYEESQMLGIRR